MPIGRWSVFQGMLNNYDESKETSFFSPSSFKVAFPPPLAACAVVVGRGCWEDYEFCQADQG